MNEGLSGHLQHPRRSLGNRHRSQAIKFLRLSREDPERASQNHNWAEQNARQALLHDFTTEENWKILAEIKVLIGDDVGLRALLSDLFAVLGRDPEQIAQLSDVPILDVGIELVDAAFVRDPLNPDVWFESNDNSGIQSFIVRFGLLDLSDPRCNVLFGRRVERMWIDGDDEVCIPLARKLLAQRPQNFEMWINLGRAHERNSAYDEAWFCYDQGQSYAEHTGVRDSFKTRMQSKLDTGEILPWREPSIDVRDQFLERMQSLARRIKIHEGAEIELPQNNEDTEYVNQDLVQITAYLSEHNYAAAFFLARRIISRGEEWAQPWLETAKERLNSQDNVNIP
jgi:hypothetical protein